MDLLKDLIELTKESKEHNVRISIDSIGVSVYLDYDPKYEGKEVEITPIRYDTDVNFAYIPDEEFKKMHNAEDYGLVLDEIELIGKIMSYLEKNGKEIEKLCDMMSVGYKKRDE